MTDKNSRLLQVEDVLDLQEEERSIILKQYYRIGSKLDILFAAMSKYTKTEEWRVDGLGSCWAGVIMFDDLMCGIAVKNIYDKWNELRREAVEDGKEMHPRACLYLEKDAGCILAGYKSPRCFSHVDQTYEEIKSLFNIDGGNLHAFIRDVLRRILLGHDVPKGPNFFVYPEKK